MEISIEDGVYHLAGRMDENARFESLMNAPDPLLLNVGRVNGINSMGVRKFLDFTLKWAPKGFRFFECTPDFIANINVIPQMLGGREADSTVESFYVPYTCEVCKKVDNVLFETKSLEVVKGEVVLPERKCSKCAEQMDVDVERSEYFVFLDPDRS